ncbi:MAG: hypothetical protein U1C70_07555 [Sediminibacterium sp.]|uniref:hypothetical protein n=1 Tax=Sediminibacterium sp. TaxID=1917865 RepID=UPI002ABC71AE|nr:hypothetical protein [Sediminibacterium sp.]MDZ4071664.1 hypothetical protein [Sediminibacterium sp.]
MKKLTIQWILTICTVLFVVSCQKELSVEGEGLKGAAQGSLTDSSGNCKDADVRGEYVIDQPLGDSNYIVIKVNFTLQGKYKIYSDTVNGMWFIDSGFALTTGPTTVKLKGNGKPILPNRADFVLTFNNSFCAFSVISSTTGGSGGGTSNDYFPTTLNSNWTYEYLPKLGTLDTFRVVATNQTIFADNKVFRQYSTDPLGEAYYFSKDNAGNYYAYSTVDFDYLFIFDSIPSTFISYPFLKDNVAQGTSWESPEYGKVKIGNDVGISKAVFTIVGKGITYAIFGTTYNDVINVKRSIQFKKDGTNTFTTVIEGNTYYAKGVGMIDQVIPTSSTTSQAVSLKRKQIF